MPARPSLDASVRWARGDACWKMALSSITMQPPGAVSPGKGWVAIELNGPVSPANNPGGCIVWTTAQ